MKHLQFFIAGFVILLLAGCGGDGDSGVVTDKQKLVVYKRSYSYDSANRVVGEDLNNKNHIVYDYDDSGNLVSQSSN